MNNTIQSNQSFQKFKEILTARHILNPLDMTTLLGGERKSWYTI